MRVGLPRGRFDALSGDIVRRLGLKPSPKRLCYVRPDSDLTVHLLKAPDIPRLLRLGLLEFGVAPDEWIEEWGLANDESYPFSTEILARVPAPNVRISFITPSIPVTTSRSARIVTPFPFIARRYLALREENAELIAIRGSSEGLVPAIGTAAVDCIETGATLSANGLVESHVILGGLGASLFKISQHQPDLHSREEELLIQAAQHAGPSASNESTVKNADFKPERIEVGP